MAETTKKEPGKYKAQSAKKANTEIKPEPINNTDTLLEGFTSEQLVELTRVKQAVAAGQYSDLTPEFKKWVFIKWLVEHDRLSD